MSGKITNKVRKLLAVANDAATRNTPEAEVAAAIAHRLMVEHAIEMADVLEEDQNETLTTKTYTVGSARWKRELWWAVSTHVGCKALHFGSGQDARMVVYGYETDCDVADYLFTLAKREIEARAKEHVAAYQGWNTARTEGFAFRQSAVQGFSSKLRSIRRVESMVAEPVHKSDGTTTTTALVLKDRRTVVSEYMHEQAGRITIDKGGTRRFSQAGYDAGQRININKGLGGSSPALLTEGAP